MLQVQATFELTSFWPQVEESRLVLWEGQKSCLPGVWDPAPGEEKQLLIRYTFQVIQYLVFISGGSKSTSMSYMIYSGSQTSTVLSRRGGSEIAQNSTSVALILLYQQYETRSSSFLGQDLEELLLEISSSC